MTDPIPPAERVVPQDPDPRLPSTARVVEADRAAEVEVALSLLRLVADAARSTGCIGWADHIDSAVAILAAPAPEEDGQRP